MMGPSAALAASSNNRMQSDFGKLRLPQPLMRGVRRYVFSPETVMCQENPVFYKSSTGYA
ncbi:MAG: hypothetical protein GY820_19125 [Gammaproteobacteria bacterium]|nr:hypothetical protein [Gammaproteobacteria bacterium]